MMQPGAARSRVSHPRAGQVLADEAHEPQAADRMRIEAAEEIAVMPNLDLVLGGLDACGRQLSPTRAA
jgi:hypothetical protein